MKIKCTIHLRQHSHQNQLTTNFNRYTIRFVFLSRTFCSLNNLLFFFSSCILENTDRRDSNRHILYWYVYSLISMHDDDNNNEGQHAHIKKILKHTYTRRAYGTARRQETSESMIENQWILFWGVRTLNKTCCTNKNVFRITND